MIVRIILQQVFGDVLPRGQVLAVMQAINDMNAEQVRVAVLRLCFEQTDQLVKLRGGHGVAAWNIEQVYRCFGRRISSTSMVVADARVMVALSAAKYWMFRIARLSFIFAMVGRMSLGRAVGF